jgi:hypothetical protein
MSNTEKSRTQELFEAAEVVFPKTPKRIGDPIIFEKTRPTEWPAPEGTTVTVTARRSPNGTIGIHWQRSDIDNGGQSVAVTAAEFAEIAAAVACANDGERRRHA